MKVIKKYSLNSSIDDVVKKVEKDFPDVKIHFDNELYFYNFNTPKLETGKAYTIMFKHNTIRLPKGKKDDLYLKCYETSPSDKFYKKEIGYVKVSQVTVSTVKDFSSKYAKYEGFKTKSEMLKKLSKKYNHFIKPEEYISLYKLEKLDKKE
ncbi:hypothetical protein FJZ53_01285 [Candidatus Woesearchaeota archaeon]|nr:hypothetical protein [Candidatus Woesearchaeota archaeon]